MQKTLIQITAKEKQDLLDKLDHLKLVKRPEVIERIKIARGYGDLSENSEYDAARDEQLFIETQIQELEEMIRTAEVIAVNADSSIIGIGNTFTAIESDTGSTVTYHLVGVTAVNAFEGRISKESPIGQAVLGRSVGHTVTVNTPGHCPNYDLTITSITITDANK